MAVKRALEGLEGVQRAEVSFRDKEARVWFDASRVTVEQLLEAIKRGGFRASVKRERRRAFDLMHAAPRGGSRWGRSSSLRP